MESAKIGCVILAAGNGTRFASNKLMAPFQGKPLAIYAIEAAETARFDRAVVVTQYEEVAEMGRRHGFKAVFNRAPELGLSHSVALGTEALRDCNGILFLVADQPLLDDRTVERVVQAWRDHPDSIVAAGHKGRRGNPCMFPRAYFDELQNLTGDVGGSVVIDRHPNRLMLVETQARELRDVDTREDLQILEKDSTD